MVIGRGPSSIGCLTSALILAAATYVGVHVGEPYFRYYQFRDAVNQEARFASIRSDTAIRRTLWSNADSLGLPDAAYRIHIRRTPHDVKIHSAYDDEWSLWTYRRRVHFEILAEHSL